MSTVQEEISEHLPPGVMSDRISEFIRALAEVLQELLEHVTCEVLDVRMHILWRKKKKV